MVEVIPEWRDPGRARAEKAELRAYLQSAGYSADEIGQAADHRAVVLARKAMAWDRLKAGKAVADKKVAEAPRLQKPGTRPAQSRGDERLDASQKQLRRTGNTRDAARVFERLIDQE
jgi:hypothetical protein